MKYFMIAVIIIFIVSTIVSCNKNKITNQIDISSQITSFPKENLNPFEIASLTSMREEDKLAYDVYLSLYNKWGVKIFTNISTSEQVHTQAVLTLLNKYELADPAEAKPIGVFKDSTLQNLYFQLISQGNISELEAFKVGATIEDLDIFDLKNWRANMDNQDIIYVYDNLSKGSRNHMRSFYSQLINSGTIYNAQYISQSELDSIINSPKEDGSW